MATNDATKVSVSLNSAPLTEALNKVSELLPALSEPLLEVAEGFFNSVQSGDKLLFLQDDVAIAGGAGDLLVVIRPSNDLVEFMAAIGAGNV